MEKEIIKYDASKVMEGVKDKIKATFVDLIPDDKWEEMIKTEIDNLRKIYLVEPTQESQAGQTKGYQYQKIAKDKCFSGYFYSWSFLVIYIYIKAFKRFIIQHKIKSTLIWF